MYKFLLLLYVGTSICDYPVPLSLFIRCGKFSFFVATINIFYFSKKKSGKCFIFLSRSSFLLLLLLLLRCGIQNYLGDNFP